MVSAALAIQWFSALVESQPTLMSAASGLVYYVLPLVAIWLNERLVVADRVANTHEFLAALPVRPVVRDALRAALGALALVTLATGALAATALLASRREGVPLGWLMQLEVQVVATVLAWHGVSFAVAHLGRWRWLTWWSWAMLALVFDAWLEHPWRTVWWTAPLADAIDQTRSVPPWSGLAIAAAWAAGGWTVGLSLASWRGGALPAKWFVAPSTVQRALIIGVGTVMSVASSQVADLVPPADRWSRLPVVPAERATISVASPPGSVLFDVASDAATTLDALGAKVGVQRWPPLVLLRSRAEHGRVVRTAPESAGDVSLVLWVDPDAHPEVLLRGVITEALYARATEAARRDPDAWPLTGAAAWLLKHDSADARACASRRFDPVLPWNDNALLLGADVAEGVAYRGLKVIDDQAGEEAVWTALRALLSPRRSDRWWGNMRLAWTTRGDALERWTGIDHPTVMASLGRSLAADAPDSPYSLPQVSIDSVDGQIVASWPASPTEGTVLRWVVLDPRETDPRPGADVEEVVLEPGQLHHPLPVDPRAKLAVELAVFDAEIGGRVTTGWQARR